MTKILVRFFLFFQFFLNAFATSAQPVLIHGITNRFPKSNESIVVDIQLLTHSNNGTETLVYRESNTLQIRDSGCYELLLGKGMKTGESSNFDSIIWNLDEYIVMIQEKTNAKQGKPFREKFVLRSELRQSSIKQEGMTEKRDFETYGTFEIPFKEKKTPKKITLDFTSSYINVNYPGGRYPVFRHYEWYPSGENTRGNSFMLTYSEKNTHEFWQNTNKFGDVRIHNKPFQEIKYEMMPDKIIVMLTKPEHVTYLNETYAIKGPWKLIYLIEWE